MRLHHPSKQKQRNKQIMPEISQNSGGWISHFTLLLLHISFHFTLFVMVEVQARALSM